MRHSHPRFNNPAYDATRCENKLPHVYGGFFGATCTRCGKSRGDIEDAKIRIAMRLHLERKSRGESTKRKGSAA